MNILLTSTILASAVTSGLVADSVRPKPVVSTVDSSKSIFAGTSTTIDRTVSFFRDLGLRNIVIFGDCVVDKGRQPVSYVYERLFNALKDRVDIVWSDNISDISLDRTLVIGRSSQCGTLPYSNSCIYILSNLRKDDLCDNFQKYMYEFNVFNSLPSSVDPHLGIQTLCIGKRFDLFTNTIYNTPVTEYTPLEFERLSTIEEDELVRLPFVYDFDKCLYKIRNRKHVLCEKTKDAFNCVAKGKYALTYSDEACLLLHGYATHFKRGDSLVNLQGDDVVDDKQSVGRLLVSNHHTVINELEHYLFCVHIRRNFYETEDKLYPKSVNFCRFYDDVGLSSDVECTVRDTAVTEHIERVSGLLEEYDRVIYYCKDDGYCEKFVGATMVHKSRVTCVRAQQLWQKDRFSHILLDECDVSSWNLIINT